MICLRLNPEPLSSRGRLAMLLPFGTGMQRVLSLKPQLSMTLFAWRTIRCLPWSWIAEQPWGNGEGASARAAGRILKPFNWSSAYCSNAVLAPGPGPFCSAAANAVVAGTDIPYTASLKLGPCMMLRACCTHAVLAPGSGPGSFRSR